MQSSEVKLSLRLSGSVKCSTVHFSLLKCCPAQSSPLHSHWRAVQSSPFSGICARPVQSRPVRSQFIPFHLSSFQSSIAHSPVPPNPEQLTAVESSRTQSCSVKLGTTKRIAARPVKWIAIRKSPHWSPYKCISVQSSVDTPTQSRASTYGIVVNRSFYWYLNKSIPDNLKINKNNR